MGVSTRLILKRGQDNKFVVRFTDVKTGNYFDWTNITEIQLDFPNKDRGVISLMNVVIPAVKAQVTYKEKIFIAVNAGSIGNGISLNFNGVDTISTIVGAWNTANPTNTVSHNAIGTEILASGVAKLNGGYNSYTPITVYGDPKMGKLQVVMPDNLADELKLGTSQTIKAIADEGLHVGGERTVAYFYALDVI